MKVCFLSHVVGNMFLRTFKLFLMHWSLCFDFVLNVLNVSDYILSLNSSISHTNVTNSGFLICFSVLLLFFARPEYLVPYFIE